MENNSDYQKLSMEKGDKIVCIDIVGNPKYGSLTLGKTYTILDLSLSEIDHINFCNVVNNHNDNCQYFAERFITLREHRKKKLEAINESRR